MDRYWSIREHFHWHASKAPKNRKPCFDEGGCRENTTLPLMKNATFVVRPCEILHWASYNLVHYVGLHSGVAKVGDGCSMYVVSLEVYKGKKFGASSFYHCQIPRRKNL
jgi:hypothetical protein